MASMDGWLKNQAKGLRSFAGSPGANAYNSVQVAQAGDPRAEAFLRQAGGGNSVGGSSILPPKSTPAMPPYDPSEAIGGSKLDRRGPNFGVPPGPAPQSLADSPIQIAQAPTGELQPADPAAMDAFMKKMGTKPTAPMAPAPVAPAPPAATPFDQKKTLEKRLKDAGADAGAAEPVYTAARGGEFDTGDEVLVGEQGPEVVKFNQPGTVTANSGEAPVFGQPRRLNQEAAIPAAAVATAAGIPFKPGPDPEFVKRIQAYGEAQRAKLVEQYGEAHVANTDAQMLRDAQQRGHVPIRPGPAMPTPAEAAAAQRVETGGSTASRAIARNAPVVPPVEAAPTPEPAPLTKRQAREAAKAAKAADVIKAAEQEASLKNLSEKGGRFTRGIKSMATSAGNKLLDLAGRTPAAAAAAVEKLSTARGVGEAAGETYNAGKAGVTATVEAAKEAKAGFQSTQPAAAGGGGGAGAPPRTTFPGGEPLPGGGDPRARAQGGAGGAGGAGGPPSGSRFEQAAEAMRKQAGVYGDTARTVKDAAVKVGKGTLGLGTALARRVPLAAQVYEVADTASRMATPGNAPGAAKRQGIRGGIRMAGQGMGGVAGGILGAGIGTLATPAGTVPGGILGVAGGTVIGGEIGDWISDRVGLPKEGQSLMDRLDSAQVTPPAPPPGQRATQSGSIGVDEGNAKFFDDKQQAAYEAKTAKETERRAVLDYYKLESQIQANRALASPEAGGTGISVGGLRGDAIIGGDRSNGGGFTGGVTSPGLMAIGRVAGFGGATRLEAGNERRDIARETNRVNAAKAAFDIGERARAAAEKTRIDDRAFEEQRRQADRTYSAGQLKDTREINMRDAGVEMQSLASQLTPTRTKDETPDMYKGRLQESRDDLERRARYSVNKRDDRLRYEDMTGAQRAQLKDALKSQNKVLASRGTLLQVIHDYFGDAQVDSDNAYSFMPAVKDAKGRSIAAEPNGLGQLRIQTVNGNTILVREMGGGKFNLGSSNDPVDGDMMKLMQPQIDEYIRRNPRGR